MDDVSSSSSSNSHLHQLAIDAALHCEWNEAIHLNEEIVKQDPTNTASLNRLARALFELGKYTQAKKIYQNVLTIDPYNVIAQKYLKKVSAFKVDKDGSANHHTVVSNVIIPSMFLEEPGITKIVNLIKIAEPAKLSLLCAGALVNLNPKSRAVTVTDFDNNYLGSLPDDTAHHILKLIKGGNKYQALIKSVKSNSITILIREIFRSRRFHNQPSFLDNAKVLTYSSENITTHSDDDEVIEEIEEFEGYQT